MKFKNKKIVLAVALMTCILFTGCGSSNKNDSLSSVTIGKKQITLKSGDEIKADVWNETQVSFNEENYDKIPVLYGGITIGSDLDEVIRVFNITEGNALVNYEYDPYEDGCTEVKTISYSDTKFFDTDHVLDANFIFGYKVDEENAPMTSEELEKYCDNGNTTNGRLLIYKIDINGLEDAAVKVKQVAAIRVTME